MRSLPVVVFPASRGTSGSEVQDHAAEAELRPGTPKLCPRRDRPSVPGQQSPVSQDSLRPCVRGQKKPRVLGQPDLMSQDSQTVCPGTAKSCVPERPDPLRVAMRPETRREIPAQLFPGTRRALSTGGVPTVPAPQPGPEQRQRGKRSPRPGQAPLPAPGRPPSRGRPRLLPCPLRTHRPLRGAGAGPPAAPRAAPSACRPSPAGTTSATASLHHRDWHRSATGNKAGSGTGPAPGTGPAAALGAGRAPLRRAWGPPAPPPRPGPPPAGGGTEQPRRCRAKSALQVLRGHSRALSPRSHTAFTPLRGGDSPLPWAAVPRLDSPFCEGIFPMSNLNLSCHSLRQIFLVLSFVTWE